jgi:hypothetical protein
MDGKPGEQGIQGPPGPAGPIGPAGEKGFPVRFSFLAIFESLFANCMLFISLQKI